MKYAEPIERLIKALSGLPGIGEKSATRLALYILNSRDGYVEELAASLADVNEKVTLCSSCQTFSESDPCPICADPSRDRSVICVVSDHKDMMALESMGDYRGVYHVLHGNLSPLKGIGPDDIRIKELRDRVEEGPTSEVILATGFDPEGDATSGYVAKVLKPCSVRITRLASGIPVGSYVEYMDGATLGRAMEGRKVIYEPARAG